MGLCSQTERDSSAGKNVSVLLISHELLAYRLTNVKLSGILLKSGEGDKPKQLNVEK